MTGSSALPRWSLAVLCAFVAAVLSYGASILPWRTWTSFGVLTSLLAAMHGLTAILCILGSARRRIAWRVQSLAAFAYLAWLAYSVTGSAAYLAELYGGLGRGVASVLVGVGIVVAAVLVPAAVWGVVATGGIPARRRGAIAGSIGALLFVVGVWRVAASANAETIVSTEALEDRVSAALPVRVDAEASSAMTRAPAICDAPPGPGETTVLVAAEGSIACVQARDLDATLERISEVVPDRSRVAIDIVTAARDLAAIDPVADLFALRPGLDGVCEGNRCLAPWQLVALQAFSAVAPIDVLNEVRVGFDPAAIRAALGSSGELPLVRIETASFATDAAGDLHALRRLRTSRPALDDTSLRVAVRTAEDYIASAQLPDGRFEYSLDPYTGEVSMAGFSVARQAGTTLALCELAEERSRAAAVATASLQVLADLAARHDDLVLLHDPVDPGEALPDLDLGDSALGAIAFLSCRGLVGDRFDAEIDVLTRFLLAMQREDGSFHPQFDTARGEIVRGPDPLFAVGQAVFALVLLEQVDDPDRFAAPATVRAAVQAAMDYVERDYWPGFGSDFFYMEENWHCLAARAALASHRHDGYERFCVDYARWKTRLILDETDGVDPDLVGGYGFGNIVLPWSAGSATFSEAAAAALAVADARGEDREPIASRLRLALGFLLHHQWKHAECYACSASHPIAGAWSEHPGSMIIRIDFVQHAMAALGHGRAILYTPA